MTGGFIFPEIKKRKFTTYSPTSSKKKMKKAKKKRSAGKWIRAIKMLNTGSDKFCIPRKGTPAYNKAKSLMNKI